jgi:hypothetical protein
MDFLGSVISGNASNLLEYLELRAMEPLLLRPISSSSQKPNTVPNDGIRQINSLESFDFELFPNPAENEVNILSLNELPFLIEIYDFTGRLVYSENFENVKNKTSIELSEFSNGVYLVKLTTNLGQSAVKKLIVQ